MRRSFQQRTCIFFAIIVVALSVLSFRIVYIQLINRKHYEDIARKSHTRTEKLTASRGMIVDRNEETLARSIPVSSVYIDKKQLKDPKVASFALAYQEAKSTPNWVTLDPKKKRTMILNLRGKILDKESPESITDKHFAILISHMARPLGLSREELRDKIKDSNSKWFALSKDIPDDIAEKMQETIEENFLQGIVLEGGLKRWYANPDMATHLTGYTGEVEKKADDGSTFYQMIGKFGIESALEKHLAGKNGWRIHHRDARGLAVPGEGECIKPPSAGLNVKLSIDSNLQQMAEEELDKGLSEFQGQKGCIILVDPKTGDVLAMASRPHFNLNTKEEIDKRGFNYAVQAIYEPGSTIKVVAVAGAMNEKLISPQTSIYCHNGYYANGDVVVKDEHPQGTLTPSGILAKSSNVGAYKIGCQLGNKRFYNYLERFGFGVNSGISLSGESSGLVKNTGNPVDFSRATFGYAINVTPLQMVNCYAAIANGGKLMRPHLVKELVANDGTIVKQFEPEVVHHAISADASKKILAALEKVTEPGGTATSAAVPGFKVAGKTGTARRIATNGKGYANGQYTVSFVGIMPAQNPAFACIVVVDNPCTNKVRHFGGTIAAPIFQKFAARVAAYMNLRATEPYEKSVSNTPH